MKAILTYNNKYQITYIYDNEFEAINFTTYLTPFIKRKIIKVSYNEIKTTLNNINIIKKTDINENIIIPFISLLITIKNIPVIINKKEFTSFNINEIENELNNINNPKIKTLKL